MNAWQTRRQDFGSLVSAIRSGNLGSAQQAFSALQALGSSAGSGSTATGTTTGSTTAPTDNSPLATIGQALASGDIQAAQQALAKAFNGAGGGHHHRHGSGTTTPAAQSTALPAGTTISTMA
ncbi:MAG: hypothetical protein KGN34_07120 [Sphingomonadales bacterium]|nr:hypothetical protein [Sphingomonadales bacterium]